MSNEVIEMEENDWTRIQNMLDRANEPLTREMGEVKDRLNELPCTDHLERLTTIETRQKNGREFKKEQNKYRDWIFKVAIGVVTLFITAVGVLNAIGFWKTLSQGK